MLNTVEELTMPEMINSKVRKIAYLQEVAATLPYAAGTPNISDILIVLWGMSRRSFYQIL